MENPWPPARHKPGSFLVVGKKAYVTCDDCGSLVRVNKPILGSLHFCLDPDLLIAKREIEQDKKNLTND